jgi:hypothetical protein
MLFLDMATYQSSYTNSIDIVHRASSIVGMERLLGGLVVGHGESWEEMNVMPAVNQEQTKAMGGYERDSRRFLLEG